MTKEQIKELALAHGFKLKEQSSGEMDLNPYVYEFAKECMHNVDMEWAEQTDKKAAEHSNMVIALCSEIEKLQIECRKTWEVGDAK